MIINSIDVTLTGQPISTEELTIYLNQQQSKHKYKIIKAHVDVDIDSVGINCTFERVPFDRIRRITGYLVGSTDRFCDSKRAEERDRIKHGQ